MKPDAAPIAIAFADGLAAVPAADWDACVGRGNPFLSHAFLLALEESGSAVPRAGWGPRHVLARAADGRLLGVAPCYLKGHSYGEYVFDHSWAHAYERAGGEYYPKLQICVPFTPVPGPRLCVAPDAPEGIFDALAAGVAHLTERGGLSSAHVTFCDGAEALRLERLGWLAREGVQFHWSNRGYRDFDGFLADLASRKRKQIRRERAAAQGAGLTIRRLTGDAIEPRHWDCFHQFYRSTTDRKWGQPYLTRRFFDLLGQRLPDRALLVIAEDAGGRPVAGALNLIGGDTLYGRNWGTLVDAPFLHFELCYYQAIEFAIERGLARVEAGAQGEHKLARGYMPVATWSAHYIPDRGFRRAVAEFLSRERAAMAEERELLGAAAPFRKGDPCAEEAADG